MARKIDADARVTVQSFDEEHEEYMAYMTKKQVKKLFDAIFSDDDGSGCGQAFSPDAEGRESE